MMILHQLKLIGTRKSFVVRHNDFAASIKRHMTVRLTKFDIENSEDVQAPMSLATANQKQITKYNIQQLIEIYKLRDGDTGSAAVQVAVMTESIRNLARHFAMHKKDHHSKRGFMKLISRRKSMMKYLKRTDFEKFRVVVKDLDLIKEASKLP